MSRLRIVESWFTDRLHVDSAYRQNYNQEQTEAFFDLTKALTVRGGYRYTWGDLRGIGTDVSGRPFETGELRRHTGLAGVTFKPFEKLRLNADLESARGDTTYFRTSLRDYERLRLRGRYQMFAALALTSSFSYLNNDTPAVSGGGGYSLNYHDATAGVLWSPAGGAKFRVSAEYTRVAMHSEITYLVPQTLTRELSSYRDNAHTGTLLADIACWKGAHAPRFVVGGSVFYSSGSRPTNYTQPYGRITAPITKNVQWWAEWRHYDLTQPLYLYEAFRTHALTTGLRLSR
jgi:hypothetical protein